MTGTHSSNGASGAISVLTSCRHVLMASSLRPSTNSLELGPRFRMAASTAPIAMVPAGSLGRRAHAVGDVPGGAHRIGQAEMHPLFEERLPTGHSTS
eukprot:CAMPEP_0174721224 /NCGR_PEP_ID=MMETSP1094-20130205/35630_1 /TAXON_ID=156173 /ORGANISM="Chrysochromulina brevifilum, Strain UTEX LB 985" /LENGTH=96 /DNA_ID=CAMNT_0015921867 /DNA_START=330 /DNA_END=621 /DNA_ORIENTATION=-